MSRILVIDTATAACSVALIDGGVVVAAFHEVVGRGHAERLVPMIAELPDGGRADDILVDVGPGSFTGIRVGIAAARGLALGWGITARGFSSMSLVAAGALEAGVRSPLAVVLEGGHGEVFMQAFDASPLTPIDDLMSLRPDVAIAAIGARSVAGNGGRWLTPLAPDLVVHDMLPEAANARLLPAELAALPTRPLYGRAPDAKLPS